MAFTLLERLLTRPATRDGAATALEAPATGITPAVLDVSADRTPEPGGGRRGRKLGSGEQELVDGIAAKLLHGWLQNRHQTLYPLTVNLRSMRPEDGQALARWMAAAALAAGQSRDGDLRGWLLGVGAGTGVVAALDEALAQPEPFAAALGRVSHRGLAPYAYVAALVALDPHDPASTPFLEFLALRLLLPAEVVRSANRRYRR